MDAKFNITTRLVRSSVEDRIGWSSAPSTSHWRKSFGLSTASLSSILRLSSMMGSRCLVARASFPKVGITYGQIILCRVSESNRRPRERTRHTPFESVRNEFQHKGRNNDVHDELNVDIDPIFVLAEGQSNKEAVACPTDHLSHEIQSR
jgi:hypothetical protein